MDHNEYEIKKLREEISQLNKSLEWYKETYQNRSLAGVIKTKLQTEENKRYFRFLPSIIGGLKLKLSSINKSSKNTPLAQQTFCAIVNYNCNENAKKLSSTFSKYFATQVLDSGSTTKEKSFVNLANIYYSGLYNHAYTYAVSKGYKYLLFICSDVIVDPEEAEKMYQNLSRINLEEIGVYSPSSSGRSHYQCKKMNDSGLRVVDFVEGFLFFASMKMLSSFGTIDTSQNLYGWGIDVAKGFYSKKAGLLSVIDDGVTIHHPDETGYSSEKAEKQMMNWFASLPMGDELISFHENRVKLIRSGLQDSLKISIIIPCYNQSQYLKQTLYSIFCQTYSNYEILIINDGSTDSTDLMSTSLEKQFNQIKYIKQKNQGLGATRNTGLNHATGKLIQFLDADDYLSDNKFSAAIQTILKHEDTDIVYSAYLCFEDGNATKTWTYSRVELSGDPLLDLISHWEKELSIPVHCFLFKKELIGETRFDISLPNHEDWEFHLAIASKKPQYRFNSKETAYYRIKQVAMSQDQKKMKDGKNRCIANAISSGKIEDKYLLPLYKRLDYKIAVGIITCAKNKEKISGIKRTWAQDLRRFEIPYFFVIGNPALSDSRLEGDTLYVPCADDYESLPKKVFYLYKYIFGNTAFDYVFKLDDDCFLNVGNIYSTYFWNFDYFGRTVADEEGHLDRSWHYGKCTTPELNNTLYAREYIGPWCGGGFGYFLSRTALEKINAMSEFIKTDLYEDKAIGDALRKQQILPQENSRYRTLDIKKFDINHNNQDSFNDLIFHIDADLFKYEIIMELQREFHFLEIQKKRNELVRKMEKKHDSIVLE
jgi:glycosyltransferase involved in cell wall biosynthesis